MSSEAWRQLSPWSSNQYASPCATPAETISNCDWASRGSRVSRLKRKNKTRFSKQMGSG